MAGNKLKNRNKNQQDKGKQRATQAIENTATSSGSAGASSSRTHTFDGASTSMAPPEKRDSVISSTWDDTKRETEPGPTPIPQRRRWWGRLGRWWPCRVIGGIYHFLVAFARVSMGPYHVDVFLTLFLLAVFLIAGYFSIELVVRVLQGVAAQDVDGNCSVVYVTVPRPTMTIPLIGASSRDPVQGTTPVIPTSPESNSPTAIISSILANLSSSFDSTFPGENRDLATKVIAYGDTLFKFIFPMPNVTTTVSYWTGIYPTVTGPLPSEIQTLSLTTRTKRQTPLSTPPSFEMSTSPHGQFQTTVTTIPRRSAESGPFIAKRSGVEIARLIQSTAADLTKIAPTQTSNSIAEPTLCGESGNFTLTFDDTVVGGDNKILLVASGMKNPYHHLFYANGFTHVPDKWEPYPAVSQPNVAMFLPLAGRLLPNTPFAGTLLPGELGAGPRASVSAYWFNAYSAYFGCALNGLTPCTLRISGFRYDGVIREEVLVVEQTAILPACWGYIRCRLTQVFFNDQFRALSGIQFNAYTYNLGIPQIYMMDDLQMEWFNNTCSAGILRIGHR